ncbi:hypothetical protein ABPG74_003266 [Tetrahymena malaccensis]
MELVFQKNVNNINQVLSRIGERTYQDANQIDRQEIRQLYEIRSKQSALFNQRFRDNSEYIAKSVNNVKIRAIISGINLNIQYASIPHLLMFKVLRMNNTQVFWDYELIFRAGIFGFTFLMSKLHYAFLQWILKHGIRLIDRFVGIFLDNDSMNKQWIGALILSYLTYKFSKDYVKYFDIYSIYQGYKLYSDDFQSDIRKFQTSIDFFEKKIN